jgi:dTDP-4-dehydrorhamnose reductase
MKFLILGKGFIGKHLYNFLNKKYNVVILDKSSLNYSDEDILKKYLQSTSFDFVINCCGYTGHPNVDACESNKNDCVLYNIQTPIVINKVCNDLKLKIVHISSGCIYTDYTKDYTEEDYPNFGLTSDVSSYYSKCKHIFEIACAPFKNTAILRIRMPCTNTLEPKNYLYKLYKYNNLISFSNSLTYVEDLNKFVEYLCSNFIPGIYNVVNSPEINAKKIINIFVKHNLINKNWNFVDIDKLSLKANRSNCVLSNKKVTNLGFTFLNTEIFVDKCISDMKILLNENIEQVV